MCARARRSANELFPKRYQIKIIIIFFAEEVGKYFSNMLIFLCGKMCAYEMDMMCADQIPSVCARAHLWSALPHNACALDP